MTPVFMPVDFGKDPNPFDFQRHATEDARKNRHEAPQKLQNSSLSIVLVDDLLLTSFDLVRLSRFQVG
jgi:type I site-specific restriction-modification system R (restriction) subunit